MLKMLLPQSYLMEVDRLNGDGESRKNNAYRYQTEDGRIKLAPRDWNSPQVWQ